MRPIIIPDSWDPHIQSQQQRLIVCQPGGLSAIIHVGAQINSPSIYTPLIRLSKPVESCLTCPSYLIGLVPLTYLDPGAP